jgi:hypothetical protein
MTATHTIRLNRGRSTSVPATEATPGLYVYELPDSVNPGDVYRWRIGHHTGRALAVAAGRADALAGAAAVADLADWTRGADVLACVPAAELARRLKRQRCYRAGY